ncbi:MAG TPA: hypothetical protein VFR99_01945 [Marmoricola sp.]|nr:hypothetical protein [Marmoricola sp.]
MVDSSAELPRVFLHVGLPKTGTTFLQRLLRENRDLLAAHGVQYPADGPGTMFNGAIEVRDAYDHWGRPPEQIGGTWDRLCEQARQFPGSTVLGHEIMAAATPRQVERVGADLEGAELHLVVTVRDLGRQIPAWWQEWVKDRRSTTFAETMDRQVLPGWDVERKKSMFWQSQDLVGVLRRWGAVVPPERTHVVTVPPSGADALELWRRFLEAIGITQRLEVDPGPRSNESLGITEVALLRGTNKALGDRLVQPHYGPVVKHWFTGAVLSPRSSSRPMLPADWSERVEQMTDRWRSHLAGSPIRVHGSLDDLAPTVAEPGAPAPDDVTDADIAGLAPRVVADLLLEVSRLRQERQQLQVELAAAQQPGPAVSLLRRGRHLLGRVRRRALGRRDQPQ